MADAQTVRALRGALLAILSLGIVGTLAELSLLGHTEDYWQLLPLWLLAVGLPVTAACLLRPVRSTLRLLQALMSLFVLSGLAGVWLHYGGNVEFELEMYPSRSGVELFRESLSGATPVLAPGTMLLLGLVGLTFAFRHPALNGRRE